MKWKEEGVIRAMYMKEKKKKWRKRWRSKDEEKTNQRKRQRSNDEKKMKEKMKRNERKRQRWHYRNLYMMTCLVIYLTNMSNLEKLSIYLDPLSHFNIYFVIYFLMTSHTLTTFFIF